MPEPAPRDQILQLITGYWMSRSVYVAAKLKLADLMAVGPKTVDELAAHTNTHPRSLYRLMALASIRIFEEDATGKFILTPLAERLRSDLPGSQWAIAVMMGEEHYRSWGDLLESIRTGETAFDRIYGEPIFDYLTTHAEPARIFDAAMTAFHGPETQALLNAYDFSHVKVLADIGGGNGSNLAGLLGRYPKMRGLLFDLPHVVERAKPGLERAAVLDRCEIVAGSFFETIPGGADAYFLRHIIHDWDDDKSLVILKNIRKAMPAGAKVLVYDHVLLPGNAFSFGKFLDLNMLLLPGGAERTEEEFRSLYSRAGFRLTRIVQASGDLGIVEGEGV